MRVCLLGAAALVAAGALLASSGCSNRLKLAKGEKGEVVKAEGWAPIDPKDAYGTKQRALAEAQRKAVERVVGVYISAKSRVNQAVEVDQNILANVGGYVRKFEVLDEREEEGFHKTRIKAVVLYEKVGQDLKKAGLIRPEAPPGNPKVAVLLLTKGEFARSTEGRAAQGVRRALLELGFQVVELGEGQPALRKSTDTATAVSVGKSLDADLVIKGEAEAYALPRDPRLGGFISYRARVTLEALKPATGEVVSSKVQEASALDPSAELAAGKALDTTGSMAGEAMAAELTQLLGQRVNIALRAAGMKSLEEVRRFADDVRLLPEVAAVTLSSYEGEEGAVFTVTAEKITADQLAAAMLLMRKYAITVGSVTPYELSVHVQGRP
ncbi:MAG TPA: hypothetical protein DCM05_16635 [Elusimicrobia bacterium]|nr:hypothetical protein [Elusimicrobiota bacterium]